MLSIETDKRLAKLMMQIAEGERTIEISRQVLSDLYDFDAYQIFKNLLPLEDDFDSTQKIKTLGEQSQISFNIIDKQNNNNIKNNTTGALNQYDVNVFWENSGLQEAEERRLVNESFVNTLPKVVAPVETNLPYSQDFINKITEMACEYNRSY